jgi:Flp pilus assembly protein TadD
MKSGVALATQEKDQGLHENAIRRLSSLNQDFPWSDVVKWELAIALDENGRSRQALSLIHEAILLRPHNSLVWHSFAVILKHLGAERAAVFAKVMQGVIEEAAQERGETWDLRESE